MSKNSENEVGCRSGKVIELTAEKCKGIVERFMDRLSTQPRQAAMCPRCGRICDLRRGALSRRADVTICPNCGTEEAIADFHGEADGCDQWALIQILFTENK